LRFSVAGFRPLTLERNSCYPRPHQGTVIPIAISTGTFNGDINAAITACTPAAAVSLWPAGSYSRQAHLPEEPLNLHLSEGSVLKFSTTLRDYLPVVFTRFEVLN
jgi:hypothetical protein